MAESGVENTFNRVTIVLPVYADWPTVRACIRALQAHADPSSYDVLIVNDCGPEADELEAGIRGMTFGDRMFRYARNPENLGFVRTCNRAVFELDATANDILLLNSDTEVTAGALDEMRRVLSLSDRHAAVCPRSNDATIASIPFFRRAPFADRASRRALEVHEAIGDQLPEYYVAPVAIGFCFLVRRSVIEQHGLFDEIYGRGYNEENDFCMRVNDAGYSSIIANRAFVLHVGSSSFGAEQRQELETRNSIVLRDRYPHYLNAVSSFIRDGYAAVDRFADIIVPSSEPHRSKVLVDLRGMGSADQQVRKALESLLTHLGSLSFFVRFDVTVTGSPEDLLAIAPRHAHLRLLSPNSIDEVFDIGIASTGAAGMEHLTTLHDWCAHWVVMHTGERSIGSWRVRAEIPTAVTAVTKMLRWADVIVAADDSALVDVKAAGVRPSAESRKVLLIGDAAQPGQELRAQLEHMVTAMLDSDRLVARDGDLSDAIRVWRASNDAANSAQMALQLVAGSRSYRLSSWLARPVTIVRRLARKYF